MITWLLILTAVQVAVLLYLAVSHFSLTIFRKDMVGVLVKLAQAVHATFAAHEALEAHVKKQQRRVGEVN